MNQKRLKSLLDYNSMRKLIIYIILHLGIISCKDHTTTVSQPKPCPMPAQIVDGMNADPIWGHDPCKLSPDGTKLLIIVEGYILKVLDLKTLSLKAIDFQSKLPKNMKLFSTSANVVWCPYDNNRIIAQCGIEIDTIGDGKNYLYGQQLIETTIDGNELNIVTPKVLGPTGEPNVLGIYAWLPNSTSGDDKFLLTYSPKQDGSSYHVYSPQKQTFEPINFNEPNGATFTDYTYDMKYTLWSGYTQNYIGFNNNFYELTIKDSNIADAGFGTFNPSRKKFSFSVWVHNSSTKDSNNRGAEIWIIDFDKFLQNPTLPLQIEKIINLKDRFCMFNTHASATFISETTLAVNMYKGGYNKLDGFKYLYEIDINGNMIRQLTFVP